jgi:hypothetical protein
VQSTNPTTTSKRLYNLAAAIFFHADGPTALELEVFLSFFVPLQRIFSPFDATTQIRASLKWCCPRRRQGLCVWRPNIIGGIQGLDRTFAMSFRVLGATNVGPCCSCPFLGGPSCISFHTTTLMHILEPSGPYSLKKRLSSYNHAHAQLDHN